jgi:trk system potassium uptake protein TrkH
MRNRFATLYVVLSILGSLFILLSGFLLLPLVVALATRELNRTIALAFVLPSSLSLAFGMLCRIVFPGKPPNTIQATLACTLGWLAYSAVGALPFFLLVSTSYLDSFFEAMSGFTTTGITMFTGLDGMPRSIIFWRSLTQWIGGLGILTLFLAVIRAGASAHRLFGAESHKITVGRPVPSVAHTIRILWGIYLGFTAFIILCLLAARVSWFDSVCQTFTAISTGGFSPHDASIEYYHLSGHPHFILIEYIFILGMLLGGTSFLVHYRLLRRNLKALYDNTEMRYWWGLIAGFVAVIFLERIFRTDPVALASLAPIDLLKRIEENFRITSFQVVSIITTTGFATRDIAGPSFGQVARQLFLVMMVVGGCVGSTGGGIKVLRVALLFRLIKREVFRLRTPPKTVSKVIIDGEGAETEEIYRVSALFFMWIVLLVLGGVVTALLSNHDAYSSFSGMFSALGNIGPCYISVNDMGQLHSLIKVTYIFGMLAGRLEILPVLLIFSRKAWR